MSQLHKIVLQMRFKIVQIRLDIKQTQKDEKWEFDVASNKI